MPLSIFPGCSEVRYEDFGAGKPAFYGCSGLMAIEVDAANPVYKSEKGLLLSKDGKTLIQGVNGDVTIPDGVTCIQYYAFHGCSGLTRVTIPASATDVAGVDVLRDVSWDKLHFQKLCDGIRGSTPPFSGCGVLTEIEVDVANPVYKSVNGLLLSKDGKVLIQGVTGSVTIPDGVTHIYEYAFSGYSGLTRVTIPDSVKIMEAGAFAGCSALTHIVFNGNAPMNDDWLYPDEEADEYCLPDVCCLYVRRDSTGWGVTISGTWYGFRIEYVDEEPPPPVVWTVAFDAQGGTVAESSRTVTTDCTVGALPAATRDGYTFDGWFTAADGGSPVSDDTIVTVLDSRRVTVSEYYHELAAEFLPRKRLREMTLPMALIRPIAVLSTALSRRKPLFDPTLYALGTISHNLDFSNRRMLSWLAKAGMDGFRHDAYR